VILALCVPGISKVKTIESTWAATPVKIDGSNTEWEGDSFTFYKKTKVDYAFRNDSDNLYVLFIFKEPRKFMSTINYTGMTLWLNAEGKKKKYYGIKFSTKTVSADNYISIIEEISGPLSEEKKKEIKAKPTYRVFHNEVIDKKGKPASITSGPSAPLFSYGGKKILTYEFRIPLKRDEEQPVGIGAEPGKTIKIGFAWGGLTKELRKMRLAGQIEGGTSGRSQRGTSSLAGERREGAGGSALDSLKSIRRGAKKYSFWADVKLAEKQ
jgi:hypothetical protein